MTGRFATFFRFSSLPLNPPRPKIENNRSLRKFKFPGAMSSVVVLQKSKHSTAVGFSLWLSNMKSAGNKKVVLRGKSDQCESKKKLCLCSPTNHPGSFRCLYHRAIATSVQLVEIVQDPSTAVARHFLKISSLNNARPLTTGSKSKQQLSRFSKAAATAIASELRR